METDRDASGEGERPIGSDPSPSAGSPHSPSATSGSPGQPGGQPASSPAPEQGAGTPEQDYSYGQTPLEAAGTGGLREADSGTGERPLDPADSTTGIDPATGMRTAPRAMLRPVPEGFPTPPPRPALPNRRPAPKPGAEPAPAAGGRRGLVIAGVTVAALLLLAVAVGGAVLAVRALSPADPEPPRAPVTEEEGPSTGAAGSGEVLIGGATVTEVSTQTGVRGVGDRGSALEPEGEYIVVTFEITNPTEAGIIVSGDAPLETEDGQAHAPDSAASSAYVGESEDYGIVRPGETVVFHTVYDVPIGSTPTGVSFEFSELDETGTLPVGG